MKYSCALKSVLLAVASAFLLSFTPATASAATATTTFAVTAAVSANCLVTANPISFGAYSGAALNVSTTIAVTCTNTTPYSVGLDAGKGSGASTTNRLMTNTTTGSTQTLGYQLYQTGYTGGTNWGNTSMNMPTGIGSGAAQTLTVYGVVPANQYPTPGNYADTITVSVTY